MICDGLEPLSLIVISAKSGEPIHFTSAKPTLRTFRDLFMVHKILLVHCQVSIRPTKLNLDRLPTTLARLAIAQAICKECALLVTSVSRDESCYRGAFINMRLIHFKSSCN